MVGEFGRIDLLIGMFTFLHDIEILRPTSTMVGSDELDDLLGQPGLLRHLDAVKHMRNNDMRTLHVGDIIMGIISAMLVLSEIHRVGHLSNVVIKGTRTR